MADTQPRNQAEGAGTRQLPGENGRGNQMSLRSTSLPKRLDDPPTGLNFMTSNTYNSGNANSGSVRQQSLNPKDMRESKEAPDALDAKEKGYYKQNFLQKPSSNFKYNSMKNKDYITFQPDNPLFKKTGSSSPKKYRGESPSAKLYLQKKEQQ